MDWRQENEAFMAELAHKEGYEKWPGGVFGKYITRAEVSADANHNQAGCSEQAGGKKPRFDSVVTCHYTGRLINGKQFDSSLDGGVPAAFRVRELISGFQVGLTHMHVGDKIEVYIPWMQGYGARGAGRDIPPYSTLIFEIELLGIA